MTFSIENAIKTLDNEIKSYSAKFINETKDYNLDSKNRAYFCYERTLSSILNNNLALYFMKNFGEEKLLLYINEFPIKLISKPDKETQKSYKENLMLTSPLPTWDYCIVDGYYKIKDIFYPNNISHLFVEYKLQNIFKYSDLATDFLKYKLYTYNCSINTIFVYVIIDKNENYPSILSKSDKLYCYLNRLENGEKLDNTKIYVSNDSNKTHENSEQKILLTSLVKQMDSFSKLTAKLLQFKENNIDKMKEKEKFLLEKMPQYNSRVIKSYLIKKNYKFIINLWEKAVEKGIFSGIESVFECEANKLDINVVLDEGGKYNNFLNEKISNKDRIYAEENGIRGSAYSSLNLLALLDYFSDYFKLDVVKPFYGEKNIGKRREKITINYQVTANNRKQKIDEHFKGDPNKKEKLIRLCYSLLYFIKEVYPILYDIDNTTLEVIEDSKINKLQRVEEEIIESFKKICKLVDYKKKIDINELESEEPLKDFFLHIYKVFK